MSDPSSFGQSKSPAQRNIQYIQELQLKQREAVQAAKQQTEEKALLRERLSQVVLSRRTEDLIPGVLRASCIFDTSAGLCNSQMQQDLTASLYIPQTVPGRPPVHQRPR